MSGLLASAMGGASQTPPMIAKLSFLVPEIIMFVATVVVMVVGLSPNRSIRRLCAPISVAGLAGAGVAALAGPTQPDALMPGLMPFAKALIAAVGVLLVLLITGTVDREYEERLIARRELFDGIRSVRAEFYAFVMFSLTGLMLCAVADDLIWLFLALELTSLPTYVMVSISTSRARSQEAGVKYFFLGAFGAAMFLYGFALLYGAAGTTQLFAAPGEASIAAAFASGEAGTLGVLGLILAVVGVSFKIAAVPMHFYTADVYEGAASSVSAYLAFVPKAAGFLAILLLVSAVGWGGAGGGGLPEALHAVLWVMAALTMTVGNVMALLQRSVKRILAYSSISHSGYMLVGVIAGPGTGTLASDGLGATLFYLLCYGFMNLGAFAVLACLERDTGSGGREEIEHIKDLQGLCGARPLLGWAMVLCALSLLGFPPLLGFFGKLFLFTSAISAGEIVLVVIMGVNSAIGAFYYLRIAGTCMLDEPTEQTRSLVVTPFGGRVFAAVASALATVVLVVLAGWLVDRAADAAEYRGVSPAAGVAEAEAQPTDPSVARAER